MPDRTPAFDPAAADRALFGKDPMPGLLDCHLSPAGDAVRLYRRDLTTGEVVTEDAPFHPFFFLSDIELLQGFSRERFKFQQLAGDGFFQYVIVLPDWRTHWDALRHVEQVVNTDKRRPDEVYLVPNPEQQYLMQSGRTCFKGMTFDDLHRLQLDIEVASSEGFPNADRPADAVIIVSLSDNRGWQQLLHLAPHIDVPHGVGFGSERALLLHLVRVLREQDPDVIEGHNVFAFDFDYLLKRCGRLGVPFEIGRDGSVPRQFASSMRFAERSIEYPALDIAGRHVVDTFHQVMAYDVFKRDLPAYGLKAVAQYFGFAPEDRTYVEGHDIARVWREDPERLLAYALDDVIETERLARHLSGSSFYLAQMIPMTYGHVARTGPAAKIESLFVREYLRQRESLPRSEWGSQAVGGYTDVFVTGVVGPIVYADVESLYPSIMLNYDVQPARDRLKLFPTLLRNLTDLRLSTKAAMQDAKGADTRGELDARQSSMKVLINSFYGNLGFGMAIFNDFAEADRVAATGQELLRQIIRLIRQRGGQVVEVDTDGVLFVPPPDVRGEAAERAFVAALTDEMPEGIRIGFDGRFQKMLSYKKKNYALLRYDGTLKFKGSSLVSRSVEKFGRRFVREAVRLLLDEDIQGLHDRYLRYRDAIIAHDWKGVERFARTETLKETPDRYRADVTAGKRPRAASYELAIQRARATGQPVRKGDRISYYITGTSANVTAFENARLADDWDPDAPDENTAYYLKRLDEFAAKFAAFFSDTDFRLVFSPEDLFGFDPSGVTLRQDERAIEDLEGDVPF